MKNKKKNIVLVDPTSFGVYDLTTNNVHRRIVLMGEIHDIKDCSYIDDDPSITKLSVADFIDKYHDSIGKDRMLDIFSESFYISGNRLGWFTTLYMILYKLHNLSDARALANIRKRLDPCSPKYNFSFYTCPENVRVHLCDVRFVREMGYYKTKSARDCRINTLFKIGLSYINPDKIPRVPKALNALVSFVRNFLFNKTSPDYHTKLSSYIIKDTKIHKQIQHIPSPQIRRKLTKWSHSIYEKSITKAQQRFKHFIKSKKQPDPSLLSYVPETYISAFMQDISINILYIISVFMDMYLIARLLRKFTDNTYAEQSIVYVGEYHAKQYRELFTILGAKKVFETSAVDNSNYTSCVNISPFYYKHMMKKKNKNTTMKT